MKHIFYLVILIFAILSCNTKKENKAEDSTVLKKADNKIKLHKLNKLFVVGDFDGNGIKDTIFQHNFSKRTKSEIDNAADPFQNEWDMVVKWFYNQDPDVNLTINSKNSDTLHLGEAQGLYCLINIGDNNEDGKDEIAFVVDYLDFSRVNSCKIYSLCDNKWILLKQFGIHEGSFDFTPGEVPTFNTIREFLEKQKGNWFYKDYLQDTYDNEEDVGKMLKLKLDKCK